MTEPARDLLTALGKAVERQRKRRGLSRSAVAQLASTQLCENTVYRVEMGCNANLATLLSITEAMGCRLEITIRPEDTIPRVHQSRKPQDIA